MTDSVDQAASRGIRVLVIDDEASIRRLMRSALTSAGWEVDTAADGREGLQILLRHDFDVMVVDLKMHEMDGITFLQEALNIWPWLGVVILSGFADSSAVEQANALGVTRILSKPVQLEVLRENVLREAEAKRQRVVLSADTGPDRVQYQLRVLRQLTETAIASERLVDALRSLSDGLAQSMPCSLAGVLALEEDEQLLLLSAKEPLTESFIQETKDEIFRRYRVLSGESLKEENVRVELDGEDPTSEGADKAGSIFCVPIITGGKIHGLLTLAALSDQAYDQADISLLYHAANHLSTVFAALSRMRQLAIRDGLTGLYNRRHLEEELERAWLLSQRYDHSMCVVIIDIDQFKRINDTFGHLAADQALREFSDLLQEVARASDITGRYGGDELVVVLPQADREEARMFCERLLRAVRGHTFCRETHPLSLTLSIGVSDSRNSGHPQTAEELLAQADRAMYAAKNSGRNKVCQWADVVERTAGHPAAEVDTVVSPPDADAAPEIPASILVVDDDSVILQVVGRLLSSKNYAVQTATSVPKAIDILSEPGADFALVLTDLQMPGADGIDLLRELAEVDESIIKIVVSGHANTGNAIACLRHGAYDFIEKPINHTQLLATVDRALQYHRLKRENERYRNYLEEMVDKKSAALATALDEIKRSYNFTLEAMVALLDARESATGKHSVRVREATLVLARQLGVRGKELEAIACGALLHDLGKIAIPDAILLKPGPLSAKEWDIMRTHPEVGYNILRSSPFLKEAAEIVWSHQERYDGTGYPRGLRGDDICVGARLFAVVDAYDAMRSNRVYRAAMSQDAACREIERCSGTQFAPEVAKAFLECQDAIEKVIGTEETTADTPPPPETLYSRAG